MLNDPFRLRLMKAVSAQIKGITVENGYNFDLADYDDEAGRPMERVFRGRDIFGESDPLPLVVILEDPRSEPSNNGSDGRAAINTFRILIQGFVVGETEHPLDAAYRLSADIITALVAGKRQGNQRNAFSPNTGILGMGSAITAMTIGQPVHRPGKDGVSDTSYMLVGVTFTLAENIEQPYA